ncbi:MAG: aminomethyltransferase family protein [Acidimicrobiales bacterium]
MTLRQTGFHSRTAALGARFDGYAGYDFPSQYAADVLEEYWACRQRAVAIDLSPLRKVEVTGPGAAGLLQATVTRDLDRLADGGIVYTALCDESGNTVDDGTVFRFGPNRFRWVGYTDEDETWFADQAARLGLEVALENSTDRLHNLAVQGPASREILVGLLATPPGRPSLADLGWFRFTEGRLSASGPEVLVSRTGYSGELGYEIWCHPDDGPQVWDLVWAAGKEKGIAALGLDALDLVRVEAGLIFKGYEYEGSEDPFEAGIGFTVPRNKEADYIGKAALEARRAKPTHKLVGLDIDADEPFAHGDAVLAGDGEVGVVTSGVRSPILDKNIALARVAAGSAALGQALKVVRAGTEESATAQVVRFPFYDPDKSRPRS